ncbi:Transcriptional regulator, GntR-family [Corynebacterium glyciniphilum AJ 3170]|uniref:Transcriptional regulator, GntR-family n=1 Tax=Corynebacterium glyciniphilum AJ 3170 TaxID=1404245 RepID=X5E848_9CORY|nr:FadR/GntR family transcriptional regulator [Corynebacterium glyciniphilum]AHW63620.1 Transcriptional regulator, GntR-family [Corynebacterium glyciniphilum AJ 3170]
MSQVKRSSLSEQSAEVLLARVREGEWALGQKLPSETTLAAQIGVGRSTAREAIRILAGKGVLASRQGSGVYLTALDVVEEWTSTLTSSDIVSVIEARLAIETEAAQLAAERRTPVALRAIRRALKVRDTSRDDLEAHVDADTAFHRSIVVAAANDVLTDLFDSFTPRIREAMVDMLRRKGGFGDAADQDIHTDLVDAIADKDAATAGGISRSHLMAMKREFL